MINSFYFINVLLKTCGLSLWLYIIVLICWFSLIFAQNCPQLYDLGKNKFSGLQQHHATSRILHPPQRLHHGSATKQQNVLVIKNNMQKFTFMSQLTSLVSLWIAPPLFSRLESSSCKLIVQLRWGVSEDWLHASPDKCTQMCCATTEILHSTSLLAFMLVIWYEQQVH